MSVILLRVEELIAYKPRLVFAGDGTAAHPDQWNRDWFAFLPYQLNAGEFIIPYYVVTLDMTHAWDPAQDALDPAWYDTPEQEFDVTIGNCAGHGAQVSAYDPLGGTHVPCDAAKVTWGGDWAKRTTNEVAILPGEGGYSAEITTHTHGVLAVCIQVSAHGLTDVWPRWDEDLQGQVVVP